MTSTESVFLVVFTVLLLSRKISDRPCPGNQGAISTEALKTEGFGILTEIDVQATMKAKLGIDGPPYRTLGACNPPLAHRALAAEPDIGLLLPCNVVVREDANGGLVVGLMDPVAVMQMTSNPEIAAVAKDVRERTRQRHQFFGRPEHRGRHDGRIWPVADLRDVPWAGKVVVAPTGCTCGR